MTRKPNRVERPHATLIESGDFIKGVKGAAVRIAGTVGKLLQLAKNCDIGLCAEHSLQLRQSGDAILAQKLKQHSGGKDSGAHNAIVPPWKSFNRKNYSIMREPVTSPGELVRLLIYRLCTTTLGFGSQDWKRILMISICL